MRIFKLISCFFMVLSGTLWAAQSNTASGSKSPPSKSKRSFSSQLYRVKSRAQSLGDIPENPTPASPLSKAKTRLEHECYDANRIKTQKLLDEQKKDASEKTAKEEMNRKNEKELYEHIIALTCHLQHNKEFMRQQVYTAQPKAKLLKLSLIEDRNALIAHTVHYAQENVQKFIGSRGASSADAQDAVQKLWAQLTPAAVAREDGRAKILYNLNDAIDELWNPSCGDYCEDYICCCVCYKA